MYSTQNAQAAADIQALGLQGGVSAIRVREAHSGLLRGLPDYLGQAVAQAFVGQGYESLYVHQVEAIEAAVVRGEDVILTTPTASGKSIAFGVPMVHAAVGAAGTDRGRSLYLAPTKALVSDQQLKFQGWAAQLAAMDIDLRVVTISGDVPGDRAVLLNPAPDILLTNPDSLNGLLSKQRFPMFAGLKRSLRELRYVVIDEAHACEGIFGCNVANLIARLKLAVRRAGGDPQTLQFIVASATVGNPEQVWQTLCGREQSHPHRLVSQSSAHFAGRVELYCNARIGSKPALCRLINRLIEQGRVTILFVESRRLGRELTNLLRREQRRLKRSAGLIDQFHGTLSAEQRQDVIRRIRKGTLKIIVATSALEQGVDFPQVEVSIAWGFPGINRLQQRFGRAGRGNKPGLGIFISNMMRTIDQYYSRRGKELAAAEPESLYLNPSYIPRLKQHILAASGESGIHVRDELISFFGAGGVKAAQDLKREGKIWAQGGYLIADPRSAMLIPMRGAIGDRVQLLEQEDDGRIGAAIEEFSRSLAIREVHQGAIYASYDAMGNFRKWRVKKLDLEQQIAIAEAISPDLPFSTKPTVEIQIKPDHSIAAQTRTVEVAQNAQNGEPLLLSLTISLQWGEVGQSVIGYETLINRSLVACVNPDCTELNRPVSHQFEDCLVCAEQLQIVETFSETVKEDWFDQPIQESYQAPILTLQASQATVAWLNRQSLVLLDQLYHVYPDLPPWHEVLITHPAEAVGLHTLAHLILAALPTQSQPIAASDLLVPSLTEGTKLILFDEAALGTGCCEYIYERFEELLQAAYHIAAECDCTEGCPKCCHTAHCGSRNGAVYRPLGETLVAQVLNLKQQH